jgi:pSer/pThr/pTyr-binding forkhead associated (FHA) protein
MNDLEAASIRALDDEHGAALRRYAVRLTGDRAHAEARTSTAKPVTGDRGLLRDQEAIARVPPYAQFKPAPPSRPKRSNGVTDNDHDQTSDDVTRETTSAFPSANFLNEPDALPPWAPTTRSPVEALPPGSALIVVKRGPNAGSRFLLDQPVTSVGRHPGSDIFLDDVTVSRRHAELRWDNDEFHVVDVGSLNSTYVNREPVDSAVLVNGDEVQIGKFRLTFLTKPKTTVARAEPTTLAQLTDKS